jgi:alkylation response protein AidB-like acyl-CoA dehydrogenase
MTHALVEAARDLDPLIRRHADEAERLGTTPRAIVDALRDARLLRSLVPRDVGGEGVDMVTAMEIIEATTRADGSTGWVVMANLTATSIMASVMTDRAVEAIFGPTAGDTVIAGMLGPGGTCVAEPGGYRGSGTYRFGSGSCHADWVGGGMLVLENGKPRKLADGRVEVRVVVVPRDRVDFRGNWDVFGLNGTGSVDYAIDEQFVDDDFTFEVASAPVRRGGPQFEIGIFGASALGHGAVASGIMARALEEITTLVGSKKRMGYGGPIGDHALFQHEFAHHEAMYQSSRAYLFGLFAEAQALLDGGGHLTAEQRARFRQALTYVHRVGADVVNWCYRWAGTDALRNPHPLGRCLRDMNGATQHLFVDPMTYVDAAPPIIGAWRRHEP